MRGLRQCIVVCIVLLWARQLARGWSAWQRVQVREIEAKFRVADVEVLLLGLKAVGVELGPAVAQDDQAYAPAWWMYGQSKIGVPFARLRTEAGRHVFTVKVPADNELSCEEHETEVADRVQMHAAVVAQGFTPTVRIVKTRRRGWWGGVSLCLDEVTGLGVFLELERLVPPEAAGLAAQAELADLVAELGVNVERVEQTYDSLLRAVVG
jgi:adenylate cyclase, class 2